MTSFENNKPRRIIPRWHSVERALRQGELRSLRPKTDVPEKEIVAELTALEQEWLETKTLGAAAELVGAAHVIGERPSTADAARQLAEADTVPAAAREAADLVLRRGDDVADAEPGLAEAATALAPEEHRARAVAEISRLRASLRREPRQPLAWVELARRYESLNQRQQAANAMAMALRLAPDNRFVLRSFSRLAVHHDDPERGHALLASSPRTRSDPWLLAGEIATASVANRQSRLIKHARRVIESGRFKPTDVAELASALATEELQADGRKKARKLFEQALIDPTENAVAQADWATRQYNGGFGLKPEHLETPDSFEARAHKAAEEGEWLEATANSWFWLASLPFAAAPGVFGSYQASVGGDFEQAAAIARAALLANPDEFMLHNNLAFSLLELDRVPEALDHLTAMERLKKTELDETISLATHGLLAFRQGNPEEGRALYSESIRQATDTGVAAAAQLELAVEETLAETPFAATAIASALAILERPPSTNLIRASSLRLLAQRLDAVRERRPSSR